MEKVKSLKLALSVLLFTLLLCGCFSLPSLPNKLPTNDKMLGKFDIQGSMSYKLFAMCRNFFIITILATWVGSAYLKGWFAMIDKLWISAGICIVIMGLYLLLSRHNGWDVIFMGVLSWIVQMVIYMKMRKKITQ